MYYTIHGNLIRKPLIKNRNKISLSKTYFIKELNKTNLIENFDIHKKIKYHGSSNCNENQNYYDCQSHGCDWSSLTNTCMSHNKLIENFEHLSGNGQDVSCKGGSSCTGVSKSDCFHFQSKGCQWNDVTHSCSGHVNLCSDDVFDDLCSSETNEETCVNAGCKWSGPACKHRKWKNCTSDNECNRSGSKGEDDYKCNSNSGICF